MSKLSDYLADHRDGRSPDVLAARAHQRGHQIDRTTIYNALKGRHAKQPYESTLAALAAGFDVDVRELRQLVGLPAGELGPWVPVDAAASLTQDQRDALDALIRVIVREGSDDGRLPKDQQIDVTQGRDV